MEMSDCPMIMGYKIHYPDGKKPFPAQLAVISKSLVALTKQQNALLESPTGTGKTLALLTSTLSWLKQEKKKLAAAAIKAGRDENIPETSFDSTTMSIPTTPTKMSRISPSSTSPILSMSSPLHIVSPSRLSQSIAADMAHGDSYQEPHYTIDSASKTPVRNRVFTSPQPPTSNVSLRDIPPPSSATTAAPPSSPASSHSPSKRQIFFCSRTHSQLQQAINELKKCHRSYFEDDLVVCMLGSRTRMCINDSARDQAIDNNGHVMGGKLNEICIDMTSRHACVYNRDLSRAVDAFKRFQVWDIEDAVGMGQTHCGCPYFSSRVISESADIIFAPYNYLLDPNIRSSCRIDLKGAVVVFDEAHNIEDISRSTASLEVTKSELAMVSNQLRVKPGTTSCEVSYNALRKFVNAIMAYLDRVVSILQGMEGCGNNVWDGRETLAVLEDEIGLTVDTLVVYRRHYDLIRAEEEEVQKAKNRGNGPGETARIDITYDTGEDEEEQGEIQLRAHLTSQSRIVISQILTVFGFMFSNDCEHVDKYKMVIEQSDVKDRGRRAQAQKKTEITWNLWCFSADVAFQELAHSCHSIILTSGTLSPLDSFASELGVSFPVRVEANHVIDTASQVYVGAVSSCRNISLSSTYQNQSSTDFQDSVGAAVLALARVTTGGVLVFLPSYGLLEKLMERWKERDFLKEFDNEESYTSTYRGATIFVEPRNSTELEKVLPNYYATIHEGQKQAILFAVCRGKVSEGIDFRDDYARTLVIIGIPFASVGSLQVLLKRQYQDSKKQTDESGSALSGEQWYCQQAYRAVNQAVGRCIRHIRDFGAIVLCDPRFQQVQTQLQLSRWMRSSVKNHAGIEDIILPLRMFFLENCEKFKDHLSALADSRRANLISAHDEMAKREKMRRDRRKRKGRGAANGGDEDSRCGRQTTLSQMFQKYAPKVVKKEPVCNILQEEIDVPIQYGDIGAMEVAEAKEEYAHNYSTILRDFMTRNDEAGLVNDIDMGAVARSLRVAWANGALQGMDIALTSHDDVVLGDIPERFPCLGRLLKSVLCSGSAVCAMPMNWQWDNDLTDTTSEEWSNGPFTNSILGPSIPSVSDPSIWEAVEEEKWVAEDGVAYRLLTLHPRPPPNGRRTGHQYIDEGKTIVVAAKVIACCKENWDFMGQCFVNVDVTLLCSRALIRNDLNAAGPVVAVSEGESEEDGLIVGPFSSTLHVDRSPQTLRGNSMQVIMQSDTCLAGTRAKCDDDDDDDFAMTPFMDRNSRSGGRRRSNSSRARLSLHGNKTRK